MIEAQIVLAVVGVLLVVVGLLGLFEHWRENQDALRGRGKKHE